MCDQNRILNQNCIHMYTSSSTRKFQLKSLTSEDIGAIFEKYSEAGT